MANGKSFQELNNTLLYNIKKIIGYQHHTVFLKTYIKFKCLPKGFKLLFHSNLKECNYNTRLNNCSRKLIGKTKIGKTFSKKVR